MDARHFDALAKRLIEAGTRRGLLALLASLPILGGLIALLDPHDADAKGRRKRRKKRHKHGQGNGRHRKGKKKQKCKAHSKAKTCANRCGTVKNNCKKKVNCGPCACDPLCPVCQTCNATTGVCEPDPQQQGDDCGDPGQVCQADGTCACDASSCAACETCQGNGTCSLPCDGSGCCADGACVSGAENDACGRDGEACSTCSGADTCGGGDPGQPGVCGCTPSACPANATCGTIENGCGGTISCGGSCSNPAPICESNVCTACTEDGQCGDDERCCSGSCVAGVCCAPADCAPSGNACVSNQCQCGTGSVCAGSTPTCCGAPGSCTTTDTDAANCGTCGHGCSSDLPVCWDGACVCGDVCAEGCQFTSVQAAIDALPAGSTIRICAGTYQEGAELVINQNLTLLGAGEGETGTILDGQGQHRVLRVFASPTVDLQGLRITGGNAELSDGGGLSINSGQVTLTGCTIIDNASSGHGGGLINNVNGQVTLTGCTVSGNTAIIFGGGIENGGTLTLTDSTVRGNNTGVDGGGIDNFGGTVRLTDSTVRGNTAGERGGGIFNFNGTVSLEGDSHVCENTVDGQPSDCEGFTPPAGACTVACP